MGIAAAAGGALVLALSARAEPPREHAEATRPEFTPSAPALPADPQARAALDRLEAGISDRTAASLALDEGGSARLLALAAEASTLVKRSEDPVLERRFGAAESRLMSLGVLRAP